MSGKVPDRLPIATPQACVHTHTHDGFIWPTQQGSGFPAMALCCGVLCSDRPRLKYLEHVFGAAVFCFMEYIQEPWLSVLASIAGSVKYYHVHQVLSLHFTLQFIILFT